MKSNFLTIASLLLLSSCVSGVADANFGVDQSVESENLLSIEATMSRVTDLSFESGDVIGLTMTMDSDGSTFVENHEMTFTGSRFLSKLEWYSDKTKSSTMTAYYPYSASGFPTTFNVAKEQTSAEAYVASDLIFAAQSGVLPTSSATSMLFHHAMSRIVVEVENGRGVAISKVEICSLYQGASVDVASLSVAVDSSSSMVDITAMQVSESVYRAIVVPQRAALIFKITFADGSVFVREKASVEYKSGETYTAKIVVDVDFDEYDD